MYNIHLMYELITHKEKVIIKFTLTHLLVRSLDIGRKK